MRVCNLEKKIVVLVFAELVFGGSRDCRFGIHNGDRTGTDIAGRKAPSAG